MKKIISSMLIITTLFLVACSNKVTGSEVDEIKKVADLVLSHSGYFGDVITYTDKETFYTTNYVVFYSMFLGNVKLTKYESQVLNVIKEKGQYKVAMVLNMEAMSTEAEEGEDHESHNDTASGENVPVQIIMTKSGDSFKVVGSKEYDTLDKAKEENKLFNTDK